jgi:uncharacterized protein (UPF0335 family)
MMGIGHNSISKSELKKYVERIEGLEEEKATLATDIKEIYVEAKSNGFDAKILRKLIVLRRKDARTREEEQAMLEIYMEALGMLGDTPLGDAAIKAAAKNLRDMVTKDGGSATLHVPGHEPITIK